MVKSSGLMLPFIVFVEVMAPLLAYLFHLNFELLHLFVGAVNLLDLLLRKPRPDALVFCQLREVRTLYLDLGF